MLFIRETVGQPYFAFGIPKLDSPRWKTGISKACGFTATQRNAGELIKLPALCITFTSWMAPDFSSLQSRSLVRSHVVLGSQIVSGVVPFRCRASAAGLCCRVR